MGRKVRGEMSRSVVREPRATSSTREAHATSQDRQISAAHIPDFSHSPGGVDEKHARTVQRSVQPPLPGQGSEADHPPELASCGFALSYGSN